MGFPMCEMFLDPGPGSEGQGPEDQDQVTFNLDKVWLVNDGRFGHQATKQNHLLEVPNREVRQKRRIIIKKHQPGFSR